MYFQGAVAEPTPTPLPTAKPAHSAEQLNRVFPGRDAPARLAAAVAAFPGQVVTSTSGGAQAAVMLDLLARTTPAVPVIFVDTGYHFAETYTYLEELRERFPELDIMAYAPSITAARLEAVHGRLWEDDLDRYGVLTKVEPMNRALTDFGARVWLSGLRRSQSADRAHRPFAEAQGQTIKAYPILDWSDEQVESHMADNDLPRHPLTAQGYVSIGDWHSSAPLEDGQQPEDTRFGGSRRECGLHLESSVDDYRI